MVFNATFNNISIISWRPVLLMDETGIPDENHGPYKILKYTTIYNLVKMFISNSISKEGPSS
jgi:hypothetical protein